MKKLGERVPIALSKKHTRTDKRCRACGWYLLSDGNDGLMPCGRCYDLQARGVFYKQDHPSQRKAVS